MQNIFSIRLPYVKTIYVDNCPTFSDEYENLIPLYVHPEWIGAGNQQLYLSDVRTDEKKRDAFFIRLCSTKEKATWENEKERRLLACLDVINGKERLEKKGVGFTNSGYKIPFPKEAVREIIIGHNCKFDYSFLKALKEKYTTVDTIFVTNPEKPFEISLKPIEESFTNGCSFECLKCKFLSQIWKRLLAALYLINK